MAVGPSTLCYQLAIPPIATNWPIHSILVAGHRMSVAGLPPMASQGVRLVQAVQVLLEENSYSRRQLWLTRKFTRLCLSVCLSVCLCFCLSVSISLCLYVCLFVCMSVFLSACLSLTIAFHGILSQVEYFFVITRFSRKKQIWLENYFTFLTPCG